MELPYDSVILHLDICPKELKAGTQTKISTVIFITAKFKYL
jgi:hypothetical protein